MPLDKDLLTALVHLHRGELGRLTAYRQRLDATTHLAVVTAGAIVTFVLGRPDIPAYVLGVGVVLQAGFLLLEATRYRRFALVKDRVRWLETGFYGELLGRPSTEDWQAQLAESLERPAPSLGLASAVGIRLRTAHLSVLYAYAVAWAVALTRGPEPWWQAARAGPIPGPALASGVAVALAILTAWALRRGTDLDA